VIQQNLAELVCKRWSSFVENIYEPLDPKHWSVVQYRKTSYEFADQTTVHPLPVLVPAVETATESVNFAFSFDVLQDTSRETVLLPIKNKRPRRKKDSSILSTSENAEIELIRRASNRRRKQT